MNPRRLVELNPELKGTLADGVLIFDCPHPGCKHRIRLPISAAPYHERPSNGVQKLKVWQASGEFPGSLTIQPSIDLIEADEQGNKIRTLCWHGFITGGAVT